MVDFLPTEFPYIINIEPRYLTKKLYEHLEARAKAELSGVCRPKIGYIKKGTVKIIEKQLGKAEGNHFTGNVTYRVKIRCLAAHPRIGQVIPCFVTSKNDIGIIATNYSVPSYTMFIPRMPEDTTDKLDRLQQNDFVDVKILNYGLRAPNQTDRLTPQYWLICELVSIKPEQRYHSLSQVTNLSFIMAKLQSLSEIKDKRVEFGGDIIMDLEKTKDKISLMRDEYIPILADNLGKKGELFTQRSSTDADPIKDHVLGKLTAEIDGTGPYTHMVEVIRSNNTDYPDGSTVEIQVKNKYVNIPVGTIFVYSHFVGGIGRAQTIDIWAHYIRYIINDYELVHPSQGYTRHLKAFMEQTDLRRITNRRLVTYSTAHGVVKTSFFEKDHRVLSRAYFKMREMAAVFPELFTDAGNMNTACIAESPGGFIQAVMDLRKGKGDTITGISIPIQDNPAWMELHKKLDHYKHVDLTDGTGPLVDTGSDLKLRLIGGVTEVNDTGNITDEAVREEFYRLHRGKLDLITADGGLMHDKADDVEEIVSSNLIMAEILMALTCQKQGGSFVLKIFDLATPFTIDLIEILCHAYESIGLFKPKMSRLANSEKYVVCRNFHLDEDKRDALVGHLEKAFATHGAAAAGSYISSLLVVPNPQVRAEIKEYNKQFMSKQIEFINSGKLYMDTYVQALEDDRTMLLDDIQSRINEQHARAEEFNSFVKLGGRA